MPTPQELHDQKADVMQFLLNTIKSQSNSNTMLKLALAYRYLEGGQQPGGVPADSQ